jgi:hypothetical protein
LRRHLHQIKFSLPCDGERLPDGDDADLFSIFINDANLVGPDSLIDAVLRTALTPEIASSVKWSTDRSSSFLKSEIPSSKSETISKSEISMTQTTPVPTVSRFCIWSFEFVSDFVLRIFSNDG